MVCIVQDVDRWLGECTATIEHADSDGTRLISECTLPAGHHGAHHDANVPLAGRRITGELRDLADAVERISQHFGWTAPDVDRDLAGAPGSTANTHDALANLAAGLDTVARRATRLASDVRRTEACAPDPRPGVDAGPPDGHHRPNLGSPSVEL